MPPAIEAPLLSATVTCNIVV